MVNNFFRHLSYTLLPGRCQLCRAPSHRRRDLCSGCEADLPWLRHACTRCALPLSVPGGGVCGQCLRRPPAFQRCHAAWEYAFPLDRLVAAFKHRRQRDRGQLLARLWADYIGNALEERPDALVPVPLHWRRQFSRGFNQSEELARQWGAEFDIPLIRACSRRRATPAQQQLSAAARRHNLRGAFALRCDPALIAGKHLALVDDVLTTGATANTLAAILCRSGARRVDVWCLARTP